jgi:hypothetical protein
VTSRASSSTRTCFFIPVREIPAGAAGQRSAVSVRRASATASQQ